MKGFIYQAINRITKFLIKKRNSKRTLKSPKTDLNLTISLNFEELYFNP